MLGIRENGDKLTLCSVCEEARGKCYRLYDWPESLRDPVFHQSGNVAERGVIQRNLE